MDQSIQQEHRSWLENNLPAAISLTKTQLAQYSILNYPDLWSGVRFFETKIEQYDKNSSSVYHKIQKLINIGKKDPKKVLQKKEIEAFEKKYQNYLNFLTQRGLLCAVTHTLNEVVGADETKVKFLEILNTSSLLAMQTRFNCLQAYQHVSVLVYALRNQVTAQDIREIEKITQLEVLAKRLLDCHYKAAKKRTLTEACYEGLSVLSTCIGLLTGIPAALCAVAGIFFPPLLVYASILGMISMVSSLAPVLSMAKIAHELLRYGRGPSLSDIKCLLLDIALTPFNLMGGRIFSSIIRVLPPIHPVTYVVKQIGFFWNNVASNVFPDILQIKNNATNLVQVGALFTKQGTLKNTPTASTFHKIRCSLSGSDRQVFGKINHIEENKSHLCCETALYGRNFAFINYTKAQDSNLPVIESYHGHILLWDTGFMGSGTSEEAKKVLTAVACYKNLKPDAHVHERAGILKNILQHGAFYLSLYKEDKKKGRCSYVDKLVQNTQKEWDNLQKLTETEDGVLILVGFKY